MIVVAAVLPWYTAHNDHGHGSMSGWGIWDISGNLGAELRPLPFAVLIGPDGTVRAKGLVNSREQLESLFTASETGVPSLQASMGLNAAA
mgnify:CR=1 FL=1